MQTGILFDQPDVEWTPPTDWPDKLHGVIGFDCETKDDGLSEGIGPGWAWDGGGYVTGYSVSADNFTGYFPVAHEGGGNLDHGMVRRWLNHVLSDASQIKVGANLMYDLGWSRRDGVEIAGPLRDVQWIESLLDEHRWKYDLDSIARSRIGEGKNEELLRAAAAAWGVDPKSGLWRLPAHMVGPYAEADASLARRVYDEQMPLIVEDGLGVVCDLEHDLMPLYVDMRSRGVRVNIDRAVQLRDDWSKQLDEMLVEIKRRTGVGVDIWAAQSLARAFDQEGLSYGRTGKTGAPSITAKWLAAQDHWLAQMVQSARELSRLIDTFINGHILGHVKNGRVHGEFHPLRGDSGGSRYGRGAMSSPNLQQIPSRTEEGRRIRECFEPEDGEKWVSLDYSQQEPRLTVHFAYVSRRGGLRGAAEAVERFRNNPDTDYHEMVAEFTGLPRKQSKVVNLALTYGMGFDSTSESLGADADTTRDVLRQYHENLPYVSELDDLAKSQAAKNGEIKTLLGRKTRFPYWEPSDWKNARGAKPLPFDEAREAYGDRIRRAWIRKALNRLIQGSAADQMKKAMRDLYFAGYGEFIRVQVHDELCNSMADPSVANEMVVIMRDAVELSIPSKVDIEIGDNWGSCT